MEHWTTCSVIIESAACKYLRVLATDRTAEGTPRRPGTFRMLLTNLKIVVNGKSTTADVVWTGINSETVKAVPQFVEQGREHDELVKRDGRWYFERRVITSDGGLTGIFEKTYKQR